MRPMGMRVLIVGCQGQDGYYLTQQLTASGHEVFGISRLGLHKPDGQLGSLVDITDAVVVADLILALRPDRIFYLAAYHHASEDKPESDLSLSLRSFSVHTLSFLNFLEALRCHHPVGRIFYAASSHVFGLPSHYPQNETTPLAPICPYGISKTAGVHLGRMYVRDHGLYCSVGILYNHESPRRSPKFLCRKIVRGAVDIERGSNRELVLADLDARVDWGFAPEYTQAMQQILELDQPDEFIIATGHLTSVQDYLESVFAIVGIDWRQHVRTDSSIAKKPPGKRVLVGNFAKLQRATGWQPQTNVAALASIMVQAERVQIEKADY